MQPYTTTHAAKEHREHLRAELHRHACGEVTNAQRLAVIRRELGMADRHLIARRPTLCRRCAECGKPVYNGLAVGGVTLCRECVTLAAELLEVKTKRR